MRPVDIFHIGPQKCGTTWVYQCLQEHPDIACPPKDSIHYFDMHYAEGEAWLADHFTPTRIDQLLLDPTPSYIRAPLAAERIHAHNPHAKIICCLRHPLERAFSHYWHEKRTGRYTHSFEEALKNYDIFTSWVETGFYAHHLERYLQYFPRDQLLVQFFDDLQQDPKAFLQQLYAFLGISAEFSPSVIDKKINTGRSAKAEGVAQKNKRIKEKLQKLGLGWTIPIIQPVYDATLHKRTNTQTAEEKLADVDKEAIDQLQQIFLPEIERLEKLLAKNLTHWKTLP